MICPKFEILGGSAPRNGSALPEIFPSDASARRCADVTVPGASSGGGGVNQKGRPQWEGEILELCPLPLEIF